MDVVLLFPGQGSQYPRMGAGLYGHEPVFTDAMDEVFGLLGAPGAAVRADWLADEPAVPLDHVTRSQVLLFAVDHALGRLVLSWGVEPSALLGHSVGEVVAATLAGVFDLPGAVRLMWDRVTRLATAPPGGMVAVAAPAADVVPYLRGDVVVGAVNAPRQTILAGPAEPLAAAVQALAADGYTLRAVPAMTAFHSPALAALSAGSEPVVAAVARQAPRMPLYSGYTGALLRPDEATSVPFWAGQPAAPVLFWPALDAVLATGDALLCEVGPGTMLTTVARRHPAVLGGRSSALSLLPPARDADAERRSVAAAAEGLCAVGRRSAGSRRPARVSV